MRIGRGVVPLLAVSVVACEPAAQGTPEVTPDESTMGADPDSIRSIGAFTVREMRDAMTDEYEAIVSTESRSSGSEIGWICQGEEMMLVLMNDAWVGSGYEASLRWRFDDLPASARRNWLLVEGRGLAASDSITLEVTEEALTHDRLRVRVFESDGFGASDHDFSLVGLREALARVDCSLGEVRQSIQERIEAEERRDSIARAEAIAAERRRQFVQDSLEQWLEEHRIVGHRDTKYYFPTDDPDCDWRGLVGPSHRVFFGSVQAAVGGGVPEGALLHTPGGGLIDGAREVLGMRREGQH